MSINQQVAELIKVYFRNYTGDIAPARGQMAGQLQSILKETTFEKVLPLVASDAVDTRADGLFECWVLQGRDLLPWCLAISSSGDRVSIRGAARSMVDALEALADRAAFSFLSDLVWPVPFWPRISPGDPEATLRFFGLPIHRTGHGDRRGCRLSASVE